MLAYKDKVKIVNIFPPIEARNLTGRYPDFYPLDYIGKTGEVVFANKDIFTVLIDGESPENVDSMRVFHRLELDKL